MFFCFPLTAADIGLTVGYILLSVLYVNVSKNWSKFMKKWTLIEATMEQDYGNSVNLRRNFKIIMGVSLGSALLFYIIFAASLGYKCTKHDAPIWKCFLTYRFSYLFSYYNYNFCLGLHALVCCIA